MSDEAITMIRLIVPAEKYQDAYIAGLKELMQESARPELFQREIDDAADYVRRAHAGMLGLAAGAPRSDFWLMDGDEYVGTIQIRHKPSGRHPGTESHVYYDVRPSKRKMGYGAKILELGLEEAKALGIGELIVGCLEANIPSRKIIENNTGMLKENVKTPEGLVLKFAIPLEFP